MASTTSAGSYAPSPAGRPRLMILKMVLENFKSYGGVKEIGPFHKSFSSVVGPNGSGKSNVIDAMLFVFGKKANKMRLNKVSELIHKSAAYPDLDFCRVSVYFQVIVDEPGSADAYSVVPGSEFIITRTADRQNASKYFIDGRGSSFSEVQKLLKDEHGIDLDNNRFLILQGEVEQISMMKAKAQAPGEEGLLEYLEDIIGSNQYVTRIEDAEKLVGDLDARRVDQLNRVRVVERDKAGLEGAKEEAEAVMTKTRQVLRQRGLLCQKAIADLEANISGQEEKHAAAAEVLAAERAKLAASVTALEELKAKATAASKAHDSAASEVSTHEQAMQLLERRDKVAEQNIKDGLVATQKLSATLEKEKTTVAEARASIEAARTALPGLETRLAELQGEKAKEDAEYERVMAALQGETAAVRQALEAKQATLAPASQEASRAQLAVDSVKTELRLLKERLEAVAREGAALQAQAAKLEADAGAKAAELEGLKAEHGRLAARKAALEADVAAATAAEAAAGERLRAARAKLEEGRAALAADDNRGGMVKALMAQTRPGGALATAGLRGRLGDLGAIDPKFDVAITTACGALNWLVVDTTEGGQQCVEYLRASGLGRAKFICLDKIAWAEARMRAPFAAPPGSARLFDLVSVKAEAVRVAFYFALRDTLVADTMDKAVKIAYADGRATHRVVTLAGELIDTSGTMSGGGKVAKKGGMSAAIAPDVTPEEVAAAEAEANAAQAALTDARARKTAASNELRELERNLPRLASRVPKLEMEIAAAAGMRDDALKRLAALQAGAAGGAAGPTPEETARAEALLGQLPALEAEAARLAAAAGVVEAEVKALKRQVLEVGGEKVKRAKARQDRAAEAVHEVEKALVKAKSDIKAGEKTADKAAKAAEKAEKERDELVAVVTKHAADRKAIEEEALGVAQKLEEARAALAAAKAALLAATADLSAAEKEGKAAREKERELAAEVTGLEAALKDLRKKTAAWREQLRATAVEYEEEIGELVAQLEEDAALNGEEEGAQPAVAVAAAVEGEGGAATGSEEGAAPAPAPAAAPGKPAITLNEPAHLPVFTAAELAPLKTDTIQSKLDALEAERKALSSKANHTAIAEYRAKERDYLRRVAELDAVTQAGNTAKAQLEGYKKARLEEFMRGFAVITLRLKEMYQMITLGGDAELELVDSLDPFSEGIVFSVRPPKKSWKNIANLSGGEKTLSSLALVFALHHFKPTPLYVMDEIDAALDFKNVSIVANYIKERTKDAQFIIISLRNNMFELADRLVGIYKTHDVTKSLTINPKAIAQDTGLEDPASAGGAAAAAAAAAKSSGGGAGADTSGGAAVGL